MDAVLPLVAMLGSLLLIGSAVAGLRLGWSTLAKMALAWLAIFGGLYLIVVWFQAARGTAAAIL